MNGNCFGLIFLLKFAYKLYVHNKYIHRRYILVGLGGFSDIYHELICTISRNTCIFHYYQSLKYICIIVGNKLIIHAAVLLKTYSNGLNV